MTTEGWKSFDPKLTMLNIDLDVSELKVGDTLVTETGYIYVDSVSSESFDAEIQLYNLILDGDHTYYANNYLVHNKEAVQEGGTKASCRGNWCGGGCCSSNSCYSNGYCLPACNS